MVGYDNTDSLDPKEKLFAGCVAGCVSRLLTQPLDVIKTRWQLQKVSEDKLSNLKYTIFQNEGLSAFFQGHNMGQLHSIVAMGCQFYFYELLSKYLALHGYRANSPEGRMLCGCMAGCMVCFFVTPLEVVRVRQMLAGSEYRGLLAGARKVYASGGLMAFYGGLSASLIQVGPSSGITFACFGLIQPKILNMLSNADVNETRVRFQHSPKDLLIASTLAGSISAIVSKTIVYPLDLAKRRLQIGSHTEKPVDGKTELVSCRGLFKCLRWAYMSDGVRGLYRGWTLTVFKAQLTSSIAFGAYELCCLGLAVLPSPPGV